MCAPAVRLSVLDVILLLSKCECAELSFLLLRWNFAEPQTVSPENEKRFFVQSQEDMSFWTEHW